MNLEQLKYPIGKFKIPEKIKAENIENWITTLEQFPNKLSKLVVNLNEEQLNTTYRENGWTVKQVIHHCYDSHHNSYTRFKWTLTEKNPLIKAYFEEKWAELSDGKQMPILLSLNALAALHAKWTYFLRKLSNDDLNKYFIHPENNEKVTLKENIGIYAWHCNHHFEHINQLMIRKNWI